MARIRTLTFVFCLIGVLLILQNVLLVLSALDEIKYLTSAAQTAAWPDYAGLAFSLVSIAALTLLEFFLRYLYVMMLKPMEQLRKFSEKLASETEHAERFPVIPACHEVTALGYQLNLLRDRLLTLTNKLQLSLSRENEVRREIEFYGHLQQQIVFRMLMEMNYPLSVLKGCLLLAGEELPAGTPAAGDLAGAVQNIGRLSRQIERTADIISLTRARSDTLSLSDFSTDDFLQELYKLNVMSLQARQVTLITRLSASAPAMLHTDRELLTRMLNALIRSVGRASGIGENVTLSCRGDGDELFFEVQDSRQSRCREPLADLYSGMLQNDEENEELFSAAGVNVLGLLFIRKVAEKANWQLEVFSTSQSYSAFRLIVPQELPEKTGLNLMEYRKFQRDAKDSGPANAALPCGEIRLLLFDSMLQDAEVIRRFCEKASFPVKVITDMQSLAEIIPHQNFDVMIYSEASGMDWPHLQEMLPEAVINALPPLLVLTPRVEEELPAEAADALPNGIQQMAYPLNYALLTEELRRIAGKRR